MPGTPEWPDEKRHSYEQDPRPDAPKSRDADESYDPATTHEARKARLSVVVGGLGSHAHTSQWPEASEQPAMPVPGEVTVVFFDHFSDTWDGPEQRTGSITFPDWDAAGGEKFSAEHMAAAIWNMKIVLAGSGVSACGSCLAVIGEGEPWPDRSPHARDERFWTILQAYERLQDHMGTLRADGTVTAEFTPVPYPNWPTPEQMCPRATPGPSEG